MNKFFKNIGLNISRLLLFTAVAAGAASCNAIYEDEGDCSPKYLVKFEYTMHMEKGDAFKEQVQAVDLWIFDHETGEYVKHYYSTVSDLSATNYMLPIDVEPGEYDFIAWCGDINNRHFKVNDVISHHTHATCRLDKRNYEGNLVYSNDDLDLLFHGKLDNASLPDKEGTYIYTIPLIRDVNNISITLQHISGDFDTSTKRITMNERNGSMHHDNSIDMTDEEIEYRPWSLRAGALENADAYSLPGTKADSEESDNVVSNFMNVELSTARLMADHNPIITIADTETGETLFEIPVVKWLLQLRSKRYADMDEQEYLDRKNQHELMVLLQDDGNGGWMAVSVVINGWHMIDNGDHDI